MGGVMWYTVEKRMQLTLLYWLKLWKMWLNYLTLRFHSNLLFWWPPMSHASWYSCPYLVPSVWIWAAFVTCFNQEIVINGTVLGLEPWQFPRLNCGGSQLPHKKLNYQEQRRVPEITMWRRMETLTHSRVRSPDTWHKLSLPARP